MIFKIWWQYAHNTATKQNKTFGNLVDHKYNLKKSLLLTPFGNVTTAASRPADLLSMTIIKTFHKTFSMFFQIQVT